MISFKDKNSIWRKALSIFGSHAGGVVIAFVVCIGVSGIMDKTWGLWLSLLATGFVCAFPVYNISWSYGHGDLNRANFGHITRNKFYGFKIGAIAAIPLYISSIIFMLSFLGVIVDISPIYRMINSNVWPLLNIIKLAPNLTTFNWLHTILFMIIPPAYLICVSGVGYILGNHDISPMAMLVYKNKKEK